MLTEFGTYSFLIIQLSDLPSFKVMDRADGFRKEIYELPQKSDDWSKYTFVFLDKGGGELIVLKDNTSKFTVLAREIQNNVISPTKDYTKLQSFDFKKED